MITGKNLIELGFQPESWFGEALKEINTLTYEPTFGKIIEICNKYQVETIHLPLNEPISGQKSKIYISLDGSTEELKNIEKVVNSMLIASQTPTVKSWCVMPDACPAGEAGQITVGGVITTENAIHPGMHSADICCSLMMTEFNENIAPKDLLLAMKQTTHFGVGGRKYDECFEVPGNLIQAIEGNQFLNCPKSIKLARSHMGTQGDGNHFAYVGISKQSGKPCLITHHGSRGFGALLYKKGMTAAIQHKKKACPEALDVNAWLPYDSSIGEEYWEALQIIREWTRLNHVNLHLQAGYKLGVEPDYGMWNEHNFIFKEDNLFHHAKGATPIGDTVRNIESDGKAIIPLNMAEPILIVKKHTGNDNKFCPHGAGRNISRTEHKKNFAEEGKTTLEKVKEETAGLDVHFFCGTPDVSELPSAYKNGTWIKEEIARFNLAEIVDEILPYGCIMAGETKRKKRKTKPFKQDG